MSTLLGFQEVYAKVSSIRARVDLDEAYLKILKISSISESPGNRGFRVHISAKIAPTDHMSTPVEY